MNETPVEQNDTVVSEESVRGGRFVERVRNNPNNVVLSIAAIIITTVSCVYYFVDLIANGIFSALLFLVMLLLVQPNL